MSRGRKARPVHGALVGEPARVSGLRCSPCARRASAPDAVPAPARRVGDRQPRLLSTPPRALCPGPFPGNWNCRSDESLARCSEPRPPGHLAPSCRGRHPAVRFGRDLSPPMKHPGPLRYSGVVIQTPEGGMHSALRPRSSPLPPFPPPAPHTLPALLLRRAPRSQDSAPARTALLFPGPSSDVSFMPPLARPGEHIPVLQVPASDAGPATPLLVSP